MRLAFAITLLSFAALAAAQSSGGDVLVVAGDCSQDPAKCFSLIGAGAGQSAASSFIPSGPSFGFAPTKSRCDQYDSYIQKYYGGSANLQSVGITPDWIKALALQESGCNPSPANGQGPMQVVACAAARCSLDANFRNGIGMLDSCAAKSRGLAGLVGAQGVQKLVGLCYNRGSGTLGRAVTRLRNQQELYSAMNAACLSYFSAGLCNRAGYGAYYWDRVVSRHKELYGA